MKHTASKLINLIKLVFEKILDFTFPKTKEIILLEKMTESDWRVISSPLITVNQISAFSYKNKQVAEAIAEIKYKANIKILGTLSSFLANIILEKLSDSFNMIGEDSPILVPIPESLDRKNKEGFHHTKAIASKIATIIDSEVYDCIQKIKETPRLATLSKNEREMYINNAFKVRDGIRINRPVVIIDDITTTGATLKEAERALKVAGARKIFFATLARA